nr:MAG TPA: metallophosphatase domain protein [Caudoviricetes sp.]
MGKRFVVGDIHGAHKALTQVLERSKFDYENDLLIIIGDVCDGWPETRKCVDELLKIKDRVFVLGNHDFWMWRWLTYAESPKIWLSQGGQSTVECYGGNSPPMPDSHIKFWNSFQLHYLTDDSKFFVHGGFKPTVPLSYQTVDTFTWDRSLWETAMKSKSHFKAFKEIFIGHTTTENESLFPVQRQNVWNVDQGAGWGGRLTIMDIDTKEFWSSDIVKTLYKEGGR